MSPVSDVEIEGAPGIRVHVPRLRSSLSTRQIDRLRQLQGANLETRRLLDREKEDLNPHGHAEHNRGGAISLRRE